MTVSLVAQHDADPSRRKISSPELVGRTHELEQLVAALSAPPAVVVVEGEAGVGKTRLVTEVEARPELAGYRVLVGGCRRIREPFPLGPVIEAVRGLDGELAGARLSPVAGALRPLLPELAPQLPPAPERLDDRSAERHRVFRALAEVLGSVTPAVLVLEDLHWVDEQTLDFLGYLLGDVPPKLSVMVTYRGEQADPAARAVAAALPRSVERSRVVLPPLDAPQTGALAAAILGLDRVSEEFAAYLCERASGLPFAIEELLALLQARGALVGRDGGWVRKELDELDVPTGIRDQVLERFSGLPDDARAVAEAAAVLHVPVPASVLIETCGAGTPRGLDQVLESGLLVEPDGTGRVGFRHLLAAEAVYEAIPGPRRRELHAKAAAALGQLDPVPLGQRAHHLRQAGQPEAWVEAAEQAADQAIASGHHDEAARLLHDVLQNASLDAGLRGRLAVKLGLAATQALHVSADMMSVLTKVLHEDVSPAVRGELRFWLALLVEQTGGDPRIQRQHFVDAVDCLDDRPDLQAWAMVGLGLPTVPGVPPSEHMQWLHRALDVLPSIDDPALQVLVQGKAAMVLTSLGDLAWRQLTERMLEQTGGAARQRREVNAFESVGNEACYAGHHEAAGRLLRAGQLDVATYESRPLELRLQSALALLDYCQGTWDGLAERVSRLVDELADSVRDLVDVEVTAGCLALARGDFAPAAERLEVVMQGLEQRGGFDLLPIPANAMIRLRLGRGDVAGAMATAQRVLTAMDAMPFQVSATRALPAMTSAMVAGDELGRARSLVVQWTGQLDNVDAPLAAAVLPHAQGFLAAAEAQSPSAAHQFVTAAEHYDRLLCPYEAAQAREQAASLLLSAGDARAGGAVLRAAMATFQRLGATWDYSRAAGTARQHGMTVPARHRGGRRGYGNQLSPREREVATLAAEGQSNEQIAATLFVSVKTVEGHLTAAMRKLGVRSRAAIIHRLADPTAGSPAPTS